MEIPGEIELYPPPTAQLRLVTADRLLAAAETGKPWVLNDQGTLLPMEYEVSEEPFGG